MINKIINSLEFPCRFLGSIFKLTCVVVVIHYLSNQSTTEISYFVLTLNFVLTFISGILWVFDGHVRDYRLYQLEKEGKNGKTKKKK